MGHHTCRGLLSTSYVCVCGGGGGVGGRLGGRGVYSNVNVMKLLSIL